jgi:nucleotide-binding universal stress UspA family protein
MDTKAGTIVVGVDGSDSSRNALQWAVVHAAAEHRALTLVHAVELTTASSSFMDASFVYPPEVRRELRTEGLKTLADARAEVAQTAPDLEVHELFRFADPRQLLLELSAEAELVVLGSRGRGPVRSLLLGSVGVALARHAHCPVVVHRPGNRGTVRNGVLVGADATEESGPVLELAYREAALHDLPLTVLHCFWDLQPINGAAYVVPESVTDLETERVFLGESLAGLAEKYPEVVVRVETTYGQPQEALVRMGERMNLVVVGAHQGGPLTQLLRGSVSIAVVEHATCPVAVVPVSVPAQ